MKKVIFIVFVTFFLNGCFQVLALIGPAATGVTTGNITQSALSYTLSYGVKKATGKSVIENVIDMSKNSKNKKRVAVKKEKKEVLKNSFYPGTHETIMWAQ